VSLGILLVFYVLIRFKERIAVAAGVEHITFFRWGQWNPFHRANWRGVELVIWKVEDLPSGAILKPNDVFIELHQGQNEPSRSRVHNNAGSSAVLKESFQLNIDTNYQAEMLTLLVKDQEIFGNSVLAKLHVPIADVIQWEAQTGRTGDDYTFHESCFLQEKLVPRGRIWLRVSYVDEEREPLVSSLC